MFFVYFNRVAVKSLTWEGIKEAKMQEAKMPSIAHQIYLNTSLLT